MDKSKKVIEIIRTPLLFTTGVIIGQVYVHHGWRIGLVLTLLLLMSIINYHQSY